MVENTDLDFAIAVALAEGNEAPSDDDFKPSGLNQQILFKTYRNSCSIPKKKVKKKPAKKEDIPTLAQNGKNGQCEGQDLSRDAAPQKKVRKEVNKAAINLRKHNAAVNDHTKRTTSFSVAELDTFRFTGGLEGIPALGEAVSSTNIDEKFEFSTTKSDSFMEVVGSPQSGAEKVSHSNSASDHKEDSLVVDINTDDVLQLSNESQFSELLRLCGEECVAIGSPEVGRFSKQPDSGNVNFILVRAEPNLLAVEKEGPRGSDSVEAIESIAEDVISTSLMETVSHGYLDVEKDAAPGIVLHRTYLSVNQQGNDTEGQNSQDQFCEGNTDDISSMMTQKCLSQLEEVRSPRRLSFVPLQNISNLSTRLNRDKQRMEVKSTNEAGDRLVLSCIDVEGVPAKNERVPTRDSILQAQQLEGSYEEDHCPGNENSRDSPCGKIFLEQSVINGDEMRNSLFGEGHLTIVESTVLPSEEVSLIIKCPLCGDNISDISVEERVIHTNSCLDKLDNLQGSHEGRGFRNASSLAFASDQVTDWLEKLSLSRYASLFVEQEIDWETLQWLTEEDLVVMGITAVGPRRKILRALQELESAGSRTEPAKIPAAVCPAVENMGRDPHISGADSVSRNPQINAGLSSNLITSYFPLPLDSGNKQTHDKALMNIVHQSSSGAKQFGVYKNKALKRPRSAVYQNMSGVPAWMCIPGTPFRVDAFQHLSGDCSHWFLTHFHTDHYQGLTRGFRYGHIFCSLITARLVNLRIGVSWDKLMIIPLNEKFKIAGVDVTFIDANHCPGSVMILFEPPNGEAVLHTGDFRFCREMVDNSFLQTLHIHTLVLDTTYCDPQSTKLLKQHRLKPFLLNGATVALDSRVRMVDELYDFPTQATVIQFVIEAIQAEAFNSDTLFLIGTYTIGKERIFLEVAKVLKKYVYIGASKKKLLECMDLPADDTQWLTCNEQESFIHVVPLWNISSFKRMSSISRHYQGRYKLIVAFSPSGWSFGRGKKKTPGKRWQQGTMIRYEVPYSEHCSFSELKEFLKFIGPDDIIPSVPGKSGKGADEMIASLWSEEN